MLELLNQLDGFSSTTDIKVTYSSVFSLWWSWPGWFVRFSVTTCIISPYFSPPVFTKPIQLCYIVFFPHRWLLPLIAWTSWILPCWDLADWTGKSSSPTRTRRPEPVSCRSTPAKWIYRPASTLKSWPDQQMTSTEHSARLCVWRRWVGLGARCDGVSLFLFFTFTFSGFYFFLSVYLGRCHHFHLVCGFQTRHTGKIIIVHPFNV